MSTTTPMSTFDAKNMGFSLKDRSAIPLAKRAAQNVLSIIGDSVLKKSYLNSKISMETGMTTPK